jgi:2,4-dienoyl-CoA reductase-like NADH-dependent reductase (Old Yellow Enzyme family)
MADVSAFSGLFTPLKLRGVTLPNRIAMPAMGLEACHGGVPGPLVADHCARRIIGGTGLVMTEGVYIDHPSSGDNPVLGRFHGLDALDAWRRVAETVHAAGGLVMPELWHVGLIYKTSDLMEGEQVRYRPELSQVSPSGFIEPDKKVCDPMTQKQIDEVIAAYGVGATTAKALGFDGLEIHAGHGYLIDQFLWSALNKRTDQYGGSPRARGQFGAEVVAECRRQVGPEFPILFRISNWKLIDYSARLAQTPRELEQLLAPHVDAGVDLFDCSQRRFWEPMFENSPLNLAGWTKKVTGIPTMTVGSVGLDSDLMESFIAGRVANRNLASLDELAERFNRGEFDLVGVGRALIAEPDWANFVRNGDFDKLKPYSHSVLAHLRVALNAAEAGGS